MTILQDKTTEDQDKDMAGSLAALKRAARRARMIAAQTRTPLVTYKNGHIEKRMVGEASLESRD